MFQYLKGACKEAGEGVFVRNCNNRTRSNGFKLKEGKFRLGKGGGALEQVSQGCSGCPILGSVQVQVG